jgi:hypothetical protein
VATSSIANADTVDVAAYRTRLRDARTLLLQARSASAAQRTDLIERVRSALLQTTAIRLGDGTLLTIDDSRVARRLGAASTAAIDAGIADVDQLIDAADRAVTPPFDLAKAEAHLRDLARSDEARAGSNGLLLALNRLLSFIFPSRRVDLPPGSLETVLTIAGAGLLVVIAAILIRGVRERIRREALQPGAQPEAATSAAVQREAADHAARSGDPRAALHAFYRYAILTLAERRIVRYEPSLTDREFLERAKTLPQIEPLRELISLHDRAWFGLKGATPEEAERARALAERAVA